MFKMLSPERHHKQTFIISAIHRVSQLICYILLNFLSEVGIPLGQVDLMRLSVLRETHDVIKWKHFPRHWTFVRGLHRSPNWLISVVSMWWHSLALSSERKTVFASTNARHPSSRNCNDYFIIINAVYQARGLLHSRIGQCKFVFRNEKI